MRVIEKPKLGHYPIALIPGQFTDHYRSYSSNQLKYMPLNTAVKTAPKRPQAFHMATATYKINAAKRARMKARGKYFSFKFFTGSLMEFKCYQNSKGISSWKNLAHLLLLF